MGKRIPHLLVATVVSLVMIGAGFVVGVIQPHWLHIDGRSSVGGRSRNAQVIATYSWDRVTRTTADSDIQSDFDGSEAIFEGSCKSNTDMQVELKVFVDGSEYSTESIQCGGKVERHAILAELRGRHSILIRVASDTTEVEQASVKIVRDPA